MHLTCVRVWVCAMDSNLLRPSYNQAATKRNSLVLFGQCLIVLGMCLDAFDFPNKIETGCFCLKGVSGPSLTRMCFFLSPYRKSEQRAQSHEGQHHPDDHQVGTLCLSPLCLVCSGLLHPCAGCCSKDPQLRGAEPSQRLLPEFPAVENKTDS